MAATVPCPTCARPCRSDRSDAAGRLTCSACATVFVPGQQPGTRGTTVSLGGIAVDGDIPFTPTAVPVAANLEKAGIATNLTLEPETGTTTAITQRRPVTELLRGAGAGKYVVDGELGRGGMGSVLRVVDRDLHRDVAMKVLLADGGQRDRRRFVEEAQITGQLEHPNIVPVHDIGIDGNGRLFFTMKLVRGRSLADVVEMLRHGQAEAVERFSRPRLLRIFIQICNAVAFAHSRGVVHRDLKPANVMLGDYGEVMLTDWGLARLLPANRQNPASPGPGPVHPAADTVPTASGEDAEDRLATVVQSFRRPAASGMASAQGTIEGTPAYMPPEQARGTLDAIDERSDIYALGAILYEILTLHPPVHGKDIDAVLDNVINHRITPPGARAPDRDIPLDLSAITLKALSAEREHRYQHVLEFRSDIEAHLEFRSVSAHEDSAVEMLTRLLKRNRTATLVGVVSLAILAVVLTVTFRAIRLERDAAQQRGSELSVALVELRKEKASREAEQKRAAPALVAKAKAAALAKEWADAIADADLALRYDPELASAHLLRAQLAIHERAWVRSSQGLTEYLRRDAEDEDAQRLIGLCNQAAEQESSAVVMAIADRLVRMGLGPIAEDLFARGQERIEVYRKQLERAFPGCTQRGFNADKDGMLYLDGLRDRQDVVDLTPLAGMPIVRLRIPRTKVIDLGPLKGMPLSDLDISGTEVRDLTPLIGAPLTWLAISGTRIDDLAPLTGMLIEDLDVSGTGVTTLAPLTGAPLRVVRAAGSQLADISALNGSQIYELDLGGTQVENLAPLAGSKLSSLRLSGSLVRDLTPLASVPLTRIALDRTRVDDLGPLTTAPLRQLMVAGCLVADLRPLTGKALTELDLSGLPVTDLTPLAGMPLATLNLAGTAITDLTTLHRLRITALGLADTRVSDLSPLSGLPLTVLDLSRSAVANLAPLAGCPLQALSLDGAPVSDLKPLAKLPLRELRFLGTRVTDVSPLTTCPLERLVLPLPQICVGLQSLRALPTLRQVGAAWEGSWNKVPTARETWQRLDAATPTPAPPAPR